jgi:hypothetical protein
MKQASCLPGHGPKREQVPLFVTSY